MGRKRIGHKSRNGQQKANGLSERTKEHEIAIEPWRQPHAGSSFQDLGTGSCALEETKQRQKIGPCSGGVHYPNSYTDPKETTCSLSEKGHT